MTESIFAKTKHEMPRWFGGTHASGQFGIIDRHDGREVARFDRQADRDAVLHLIKQSTKSR